MKPNLNTSNVTTLAQSDFQRIKIDKANCINRIVTIVGSTDAGKGYNICNIKTAYKPSHNIYGTVLIPSSSDSEHFFGVEVEASTGLLKVTRYVNFEFGCKYSIIYTI